MPAKNNPKPISAKKATSASYEQLISNARLRSTTDPERKKDLNLEAFSDKGRIIRSAAFRRLQSKAQVFSMARSGEVRTRLTHSIEVGNYGELIAEKLASRLIGSGSLKAELRSAFVQIVENACLMHDIGNPPFGHMGEYAIQQWFKKDGGNRGKLIKAWVGNKELTEGDAERHLDAYAKFDGNPQGFRIITRLQWLHDEHGLNLTCSLLASYLKYLGEKPVSGSPFRKKIGYFPSEEPVVKNVWKELGLRTDPKGLPLQRHPLTFVMEAADDIAYCLSDIEDALEKSVVTEDQFISWMKEKKSDFLTQAQQEVEKVKAESKAGEKALVTRNDTYHFFRLKLSQFLVNRAVEAYVLNEDRILSGSMDKPLLGSDPEATSLLKLQREFCSRFVYTSREAINTELGGLRAISSLLDAYRPIMLLTTKRFDDLCNEENEDRLREYPIDALLFSLLPKKHKNVYQSQRAMILKLEPVFRMQLILDYISGMTDSHALKIFNMINGTQQFGIE